MNRRRSRFCAGALPFYERALTIYEKVLGPEHPNTSRVRAALLHARRADQGQRPQ
jgi:tetratricopeptide repeat protein